jgi:hypothetical protein
LQRRKQSPESPSAPPTTQSIPVCERGFGAQSPIFPGVLNRGLQH